MTVLRLMEWRVRAIALVGLPVFLAMLGARFYEVIMKDDSDARTSWSEHLKQELELLRNGSLKESRLETPILLWWTPSAVASERLRECSGLGSCIMTKNRDLLDHPMTKATFFYGSDFMETDLPPFRGKGKKKKKLTYTHALFIGFTFYDEDWALLHEESPKNNMLFNFEPVLALFNYTATFRAESDLPLATQYLENLEAIVDTRFMVKVEEKNRLQQEEKLSPVIYLQSSCDNPTQRDAFVTNLSRFIDIDSYGTCLNNKTARIETPEDRLALIGKYKFVLAIENAVCQDYVTEKLWDSLKVGTIPIYYGAPNVKDDFLPQNDSAILVQDFYSTQDLARHLHDLNANDVRYKLHLRHKHQFSGSGKVIANPNLRKHVNQRPWGVSDRDAAAKGNLLEHFECLVCHKVTEAVRMSRQGFAHRLHHQANQDHYGCPFPKGLGEDNFWREEFVTAFVRALLLREAVEMRQTLSQDLVQTVLNNGEVSQVMQELVRTGAEAFESMLGFYEEKVRGIIRKNRYLL